MSDSIRHFRAQQTLSASYVRKASYDRDNAVHAHPGLQALVRQRRLCSGRMRPVIVPMIYGRDGETIYLHGARKARVIQACSNGRDAGLSSTSTLVDGIVLARSAFNSSMNYRSVTVFGTGTGSIDDYGGTSCMACA